jgi:TonB family protein
MKMNIPIPVIAAAPPKKVVPPPAPKMVALNVAPSSVPNNYNKPSMVALGDRNALKAVDNAKPKANAVSLGLAGMPVMNNGAGAPGARTVSLGSGAPNGSVNGTDRGRPVQGVKLGVLGGQGTTNNHSLSTVNIAGMAPAAAAPVRTIVAPTTPVTVIYTPHPAYTSAATAKGINGTVDVEVIFRANGSVQVLRVVRGLGYGLDQNALLAAASIRFKPAMQNGQPVDQHSIVHIQFQMIS